MGITVGEIFAKGGWVMWPLLAFSVITWAIVLERAIVFLTLRPKLSRIMESILQSLRAGDIAAARQICHTQKPEVGEIFMATLDTKKSREAAERVVDRQRAKLTLFVKRNLWILGTIGAASPFVGLLGTVLGIVRASHSMAEAGSGGFSVVAGGISEALIATAAGLIVAIAALLFYNILMTAANQTIMNLKIGLDELLDTTFESNKTQA